MKLRFIPTAAWLCGLVAFLNVLVWALATPPFHVPDENAHLAYVQHLAENGEPPNEVGGPVYASEETRTLEALFFPPTVGRRENHSIWYELQDQALDEVARQDLPSGDGGGTTSASNQPPLFYLVEAGVYLASPWNGLLERLALMRLLSALLAAATTVLIYLFLRELFAESWVWAVGALAVAFQPQFGFISGGVTPDSLLFVCSAALFYALARAFRRGLTLKAGRRARRRARDRGSRQVDLRRPSSRSSLGPRTLSLALGGTPSGPALGGGGYRRHGRRRRRLCGCQS